MNSALVIGSTCVDVIISIDHLPKTEENLRPSGQSFQVGGCAYNVANILKRAGAPVTFVTPVGGRGLFGGFVKAKLDQLGLRDYVFLPDGENGCCYCFVEKGGERTFASCHGVEYTFRKAWMDGHAGPFDYGYVCGLEVEEPTGGELAAYVRSAPVGQWLYAPGPRCARIPVERTRAILAAHPILHLNETEVQRMAGVAGVSQAAKLLGQVTARPVIVTLGEKGVYYLTPDGVEHALPGQAARVVDTIGAGDSHAAATLFGLCRGMALSDALALANRAAAAVVSVAGATLPDDLFDRVFG